MDTSYKKIERIKDILSIEGEIIKGSFDKFVESINNIKTGNSDLDNVIVDFLLREKDNIINDLKNKKLVKARTAIGLYILFIANNENPEEFFILDSYLESSISVEDYQELLNKQNIVLTSEIISILFALPIIPKKRFNYLLELLSECEDVDYLNSIEVYTDENVMKSKKTIYSEKSYIREILDHRGRFLKDICEAVSQGDVTKVEMICDLKIKEIGKTAFNIGICNTKEQFHNLNTILYTTLIGTGANLVDANNLYCKIKNKIDNNDFSEDIVRNYSMLVDKEKYKDKQQVVRNCILYIDKHIREKINLDDISKELEVNKSYLSSVFNREMNFSIVDYIHKRRISNSKYLLANTDYSISEISDYIGYFDTSYFIRIFKSLVKTTPLKYRENLHR